MRELLETRGRDIDAERLCAGVVQLTSDDSRRSLQAQHSDEEDDRGDDGLYEGEPSWRGAARKAAGAWF